MVRSVKNDTDARYFVGQKETIGHRDTAAAGQGYHELRLTDHFDSEQGSQGYSVGRVRDRGPELYKGIGSNGLGFQTMASSERPKPPFQQTIVPGSGRSMLLNFLSGVLYVFAGSMRRTTTN